jgi:hypothetical protein
MPCELHQDKRGKEKIIMKNSKLINFEELKPAVIAQSIVAKKAPKAGKRKGESDSYLDSFF